MPQDLSQQDIQDLVEIRGKLPQGDPRTDKIDRLLFANVPPNFQPKVPVPAALQQTQRAMQIGPGGPQFVDVPQGQKQQFEQANQSGAQTGGAIGAGLMAGGGVAAGGVRALQAAAAAGLGASRNPSFQTAMRQFSSEMTKEDMMNFLKDMALKGLPQALKFGAKYGLPTALGYEAIKQSGTKK